MASSSSNVSFSGVKPKMKVKALSRNEEDFTRERKLDIVKVFRNVDPKLHPFEKAREYTRALNAVKFDKIFAKPFIGALDGHEDGVHCMSLVPKSLTHLVSGACDGDLRVWDLSKRTTRWHVKAHEGFVRGVSCDVSGQNVISCGNDQTVKIWKLAPSLDEDEKLVPLSTYLGKNAFSGVDHHRAEPMFATCGSQVDLWDEARDRVTAEDFVVRSAEPVHSFAWGSESITSLKFNSVEHHILSSCGSDRSVVLYDIRAKTPLRKIILKMQSNAICWNPMEAFNFTVANEDHNLYTFDMRKLEQALCIHQDHVYAVMALDYSPTGREFVSGSYDRTVRIFGVTDGHSREIYHAKRMQRVFAVKYTWDNKFILSGSDDFNIRLWKAHASEKLGTVLPREKNKIDYMNKLKEKFKWAPEVRRIARHKHVPRNILKAKEIKHEVKHAATERSKRAQAHSKEGITHAVPARKAAVYKVAE